MWKKQIVTIEELRKEYPDDYLEEAIPWEMTVDCCDQCGQYRTLTRRPPSVLWVCVECRQRTSDE
jgi:hypothetical protein